MTKAFGKTLRELRKKKGCSQDEIAKILKINRTTYTKYETGVSQPDFETLRKLCEIYEVDYNTLLNYKP